MPEMPFVSIGISTFNRASSYLPQALSSALAQTYPNLEVIVSDNCSSDSTESVVRSFATERLRYFRQQINIGANSNFNFCLDQARGDYFLLLHDDDFIDPDFVQTCMEAAAGRTDLGVIRTGTRVVDDENKVMAEVPNTSAGLDSAELFMHWFERKTSFYLCSTLYHTERLKESGGFKSKTGLFQDVTALARLVVPFDRVDVPEVKASFRRHAQNKGSGDAAMAWAEDSLYLIDLLGELMPEHSDRLRRAGHPYLCRKCYRNVASVADPIERWKTYWAIYRAFNGTYSPLRYALKRSEAGLRSAVRSVLRRQAPAPAELSGR